VVAAATKRFSGALPGVPGLPSEDGIKAVLEYDVRAPMKLADPAAADKMMGFSLSKRKPLSIRTSRCLSYVYTKTSSV